MPCSGLKDALKGGDSRAGLLDRNDPNAPLNGATTQLGAETHLTGAKVLPTLSATTTTSSRRSSGQSDSLKVKHIQISTHQQEGRHLVSPPLNKKWQRATINHAVAVTVRLRDAH
jgi:hypothetical protein